MLNDIGIGNVFRTDSVAASAPHAHGEAEPLLKIINLVHYLKPHPVALLLAETVAAGDIGVAVHLTGSPDSPAFSHIGIFPVGDILHGKAGTGGTDKIAASAADTAVSVRFPDGIGKRFCGQMTGQTDFFFVGGDEVRSDCTGDGVCLGKVMQQCLRFAVDPHRFFRKLQIQIIGIGAVGFHADAESVVAGLAASHQDEGSPLAQPVIIEILGSVVQIDGIQPFQGMEITAAQEDQKFLSGQAGTVVFFSVK